MKRMILLYQWEAHMVAVVSLSELTSNNSHTTSIKPKYCFYLAVPHFYKPGHIPEDLTVVNG
jgi:hypothetical protein